MAMKLGDRSEKTLTTNSHNKRVFIRFVLLLCFIIEPEESLKISDDQALVIFLKLPREFQSATKFKNGGIRPIFAFLPSGMVQSH